MTEKVKFTAEECTQLQNLLDKVAANGGYWPTEATMRAAHGCVSMWAPEIVITRREGREIFLRQYEEGAESFLGMWHLPGGYNRWPECDIRTTCSRIALRELGVDVYYIQTIDAYKWQEAEHPYGRPLSLYVHCVPLGNLEETDTMRYFPVCDLPEKMVAPHKNFIKSSVRLTEIK